MKLIQLLESLVLEAKDEFVANQLGDKLSIEYRYDTGEDASPLKVAQELQTISKEYLPTIAKWYINGDFPIKSPKIGDIISKYQSLKKSVLSDDERDITRYKSLRQLVDVLDQYSNADTRSNREIMKDIKEKETEMFYKNSEIMVVIPKTEASSCQYGKGTAWCTSSTKAKNDFDEYNADGNLYVIVTKEGEKYQFHFERNEFVDSSGEPINVEELTAEHPSIKTAFRGVAKQQHFFPLIDNPSEDDIIASLKIHGENIEYVEYPTEEMQILAVTSNKKAIQYINNPSPEVIRAAERGRDPDA
jgi:hypothetical protein